MSDLEAEETKRFMDLGFVFTEDDLNSKLPEILPGLRTFRRLQELICRRHGSFKVISGLKEQRKIQWV